MYFRNGDAQRTSPCQNIPDAVVSICRVICVPESEARGAVETRGAMPYVRDGAVVSRRSPYRLSIVTDIFWSVVNLIAALCVPARAPSTRSRTRLRLRARLRFVALTPVSLLSDTRAARPKQLSVHARPRVRGVLRREAAAKARGRVRRQRRRRLGRRRGGPGGRRRRPPRRKRARRVSHPRARPQRPSGGRLRQVSVFRLGGSCRNELYELC